MDAHLTLAESSLTPGNEWTPPPRGWILLSITGGSAYWRDAHTALELTPGELVVAPLRPGAAITASRLGEEVRFRWFVVCGDHLGNLLSIAERQALEAAGARPAGAVRRIPAGDALAERFRKLESTGIAPFVQRARMMALFAEVVGTELACAAAGTGGSDARERLHALLGQLPESRLLTLSLTDLAAQLHCSERHLSRLLREYLGVPLRSKQTELRLLKARELVGGTDTKIINVALDCGYRHLGLFNSLFKRRFGMTPTEWRRQKLKSSRRPRRLALHVSVLLVLVLFAARVLAAEPEAKPAEPPPTSKTNAPPATPHFKVHHYEVLGNTALSPQVIDRAVGEFTGDDVNFDTVRQALAALQLEYRNRGFATVAVSLPPQQLTNDVVKIQVTEGRLAEITVINNQHFSSNNVFRALPGLTTNQLLNSRTFQAQLDVANNNRDRQIYPKIQPGAEPGTTALVLDVKDRLPLHGRFELNNASTPGTPDLRGNASLQYNNLWQHEHSLGLSYTFSPGEYKADVPVPERFYDAPLIATYSGFYRLPLGSAASVPDKVEANPQRFGFDEVTRQFRLPPTTGRPELNLYASRSATDTGIQATPEVQVAPLPFAIFSQDTGQDVTTTEGVGARLAFPLPEFSAIHSTLSVGLDLKHYVLTSFNTNNFRFHSEIPDENDPNVIAQIIETTQASPQPTRHSEVTYLPIALRWDASRSDKYGSFAFGAGVNVNFAGGPFSDAKEFQRVSGSTNSTGDYVTINLNASREEKIFGNWTLLLRADGQWANEPLISNEQFGLGGTAGVRGYQEGFRYGDSGWRASVEPRTPWVDLGKVDAKLPFRLRGSAFMDYGQLFLNDSHGFRDHSDLWGAGLGLNLAIGERFDGRVSLGWALEDAGRVHSGDVEIYFGIGAQF